MTHYRMRRRYEKQLMRTFCTASTTELTGAKGVGVEWRVRAHSDTSKPIDHIRYAHLLPHSNPSMHCALVLKFSLVFSAFQRLMPRI
jgi:hypothetical protein